MAALVTSTAASSAGITGTRSGSGGTANTTAASAGRTLGRISAIPCCARAPAEWGSIPHVERLQRRLNALGNFGLTADGDFRGETDEAVRAFQRSQRLKIDGSVGGKTWLALGKATARPLPKKKARPQPKPKPKPKPKPALVRGFDVSDVRGDVDFTKARASGIGFAIVRISDGDVHDTRYGPGRVEALRESGLVWFPYYFGRVASQENKQRDGAAEAAMAIRFARAGGWGRKGDLPLAYDFETPNGQPAPKCARHLVQFVDAYRKNRGHYPILYTGPGLDSDPAASHRGTADPRPALPAVDRTLERAEAGVARSLGRRLDALAVLQPRPDRGRPQQVRHRLLPRQRERLRESDRRLRPRSPLVRFAVSAYGHNWRDCRTGTEAG